MPSLNVGDYMEQCLSSVLNQSLKDIEVICVDAGSTDQTLDIINKHQITDKRIKIIHSTCTIHTLFIHISYTTHTLERLKIKD